MRVVWVLPFATLLAGCLLLAEAPCYTGDCPGSLTCQLDGYGCLEECTEHEDCLGALRCAENGTCQVACGGVECEDYRGCNLTADSCDAPCTLHSDCAPGYSCQKEQCI